MKEIRRLKMRIASIVQKVINYVCQLDGYDKLNPLGRVYTAQSMDNNTTPKSSYVGIGVWRTILVLNDLHKQLCCFNSPHILYRIKLIISLRWSHMIREDNSGLI